jgi:hypothetical protein
MKMAEDAEQQAAEQKQEIFETLQRGCNPLFQLFHKFSSDENKPGDLMEQKFQRVEKELSCLASEVSGVQKSNKQSLPPPPGKPFGLSGTTGINNPTTTVNPSQGVQPVSNASEARFISIESQLTDLKNQMQAKSVKIGGMMFKSRSEVKSWLAIHA